MEHGYKGVDGLQGVKNLLDDLGYKTPEIPAPSVETKLNSLIVHLKECDINHVHLKQDSAFGKQLIKWAEENFESGAIIARTRLIQRNKVVKYANIVFDLEV